MFLGKAAVAGAGALLGLRPELCAAEPPPETTTLRLTRRPALCGAPEYLAEEFLSHEGFTEVQYVKTTGSAGVTKALAAGAADISMAFSGPTILRIDAGDPIVFLAGIHVGCFELFGTERVRSISDLKGKTVAVAELGSGAHVFVASMAAHVGLNPRKDINWVLVPFDEATRSLAEGKVDAYLGFPPEPLVLREKKIGHVVVNSTMDRPWSQYFCCFAVANRNFVRSHPVATKRALRAILKATEVCSREPERVASFLVDKGYTKRYDYALQTMREIPYSGWRQYGSEDTVRFYSLRLHEAGMIKSSPQKIIAQGTDWRFLNELKKELKS